MKKFYVYIHTCPNGKKYVGVTGRDPKSRWQKGKGYQNNDHFYRAILKYGWDNIAHEVFEVDSEEEMYRKEIELISFYHTNDPRYGYNHSSGGEKSASGCIRSEEYVKHLSEACKERWSDPEYRRKMSEAAKKRCSDPEVRRKMAEAYKGQIRSEEARKHLSEAQKEKWLDPEYRKNMSEAHKGKPRKPHSEEAKRRISEAHRGKILSEEHRKKLSEAKKGKPKPKIKIKLPDGTVLEMAKHSLVRNYVNKGRKFEYVSE